MINDLNGSMNMTGKTTHLPPTWVSKKEKNSPEWKKSMLLSMERIAMRQLAEKAPKIDNYRMTEGKMPFLSLADVVPTYSSFGEKLESFGANSFLRVYDLRGPLIKSLIGVYRGMENKIHVTETGEIAENEFLRERNRVFQEAVTNQIELERQRKLAQIGLTPEGKQFASEEEKQAFLQQVEQKKQEFVPDSVLRDSTKSFKTAGVRFGEHVLNKDEIEMDLKEIRVKEFDHMSKAGEFYRAYRLGVDKYEIDEWHPLQSFDSKETEENFHHKREYAGRIYWPTPAEVVKKYGHKLSSKITEELLGGDSNYFTSGLERYGYSGGNHVDALNNNFGQQYRVPFAGHFSHNFYQDLEDTFGVPLGEEVRYDADGMQHKYATGIPRLMGNTSYNNMRMATFYQSDFVNRFDLCQVMECFVRCYDNFGYYTYMNEFGRLVTEEVTEDILKEFIRENKIKQSYTQTTVEIFEGPKENTIQWIKKPVVYEGVLIRSRNLSEPIFLTMDEMPYQIKGKGFLDVYLPVAGGRGRDLFEITEPYQSGYTLNMNLARNLTEKNIGPVFLMDIGHIASEYAGHGGIKEQFAEMIETARETGILGISTTGSPDQVKNFFQAFGRHDLSYNEAIKASIELAEIYRNKFYTEVGFNPAALAQPSQYMTAEGVKGGQEATFSNISDIFETFESYQRAACEVHLGVAQYAYSAKIDRSLLYTASDQTMRFLEEVKDDIPLRTLGLLASNNTRDRKMQEQIRNYFFQNGTTMNADTLEVIRLLNSPTTHEMLEIAEQERALKQQREDLLAQRQQQLKAQDIQAQKDEKNTEFEQKVYLTKLEIEADFRKTEIQATGKAADNNADPLAYKAIEGAANRALKSDMFSQQHDLKLQELDTKINKSQEEIQLKKEQLAFKMKELDVKKQMSQDKVTVAAINP